MNAQVYLSSKRKKQEDMAREQKRKDNDSERRNKRKDSEFEERTEESVQNFAESDQEFDDDIDDNIDDEANEEIDTYSAAKDMNELHIPNAESEIKSITPKNGNAILVFISRFLRSSFFSGFAGLLALIIMVENSKLKGPERITGLVFLIFLSITIGSFILYWKRDKRKYLAQFESGIRLKKIDSKNMAPDKSKKPPFEEPEKRKSKYSDYSQPEDPFVILGINQSATEIEIKAKYHELIRQYHPDKVAHLAPEFRIMAEEKSKKLIWAYDECLKRNAS